VAGSRTKNCTAFRNLWGDSRPLVVRTSQKSESGGGLSPTKVLRLFQTASSTINVAGKEGRKSSYEHKDSPKNIHHCWGALRVGAVAGRRLKRWRPEFQQDALSSPAAYLYHVRYPREPEHLSERHQPSGRDHGIVL
jgi:hypothetical protein